MKAVIFDMDGTLANINVRRKYLEQEPKDWDSFHKMLETDTANEDICELAYMYEEQDYALIVCTGRFEIVFEETKSQLISWGLLPDKILMRKDGDYRKDCDVKLEMYNKLIDYGYDIKLTVDDRDQVVEMWRGLGIRCLQVSKGDL